MSLFLIAFGIVSGISLSFISVRAILNLMTVSSSSKSGKNE